jgi:hypothetical protein
MGGVGKSGNDAKVGCVTGTADGDGESLTVSQARSGQGASSPLAVSPFPPFPQPPAMSTKTPVHRRKGGSVEVVDSKYAVDLATQQSYSENVFLFVPNLIGQCSST